MNRFLEKSIFWLTVVAFFSALIIRPESQIFPFVFPKAIWFRTTVLLMTGCYAGLLAMDWQKYKPRLNWVSGAIGLFFVSWVISTYVGADPYRSMWDGHERMLGLFTFAHYILFFIILSAVIKTREEWRNLSMWFAGTGIFIMLIGVIQKFNTDFLYNHGSVRVGGTLGNPIYLGALGFFMAALGAWLVFSSTPKEKWQQWFGGIAALFGVVGIFLSDSRGPFLGLLAAVGMALLLVTFSKKVSLPIRKTLGGVMLGGIVLIAVLFSFRHTAFVDSIPVIGRLATVSISGGTVSTRLMAWEIAIEGWKQKPFFGWGPNNYAYVFNQNYRPEFLEIGGWAETWFDNAHNILLNTLTVQGAFGLLIYIGIFGAAATLAVKNWRAGKIPQSTMIFFLSFLVGHLVQNIFVFENLTSYLYFYFVLAMIAAPAMVLEKGEVSRAKNLPGWAMPVIMVCMLLIIYATDTKPAKANSATWKILQSLSTITQYRDAKLIDSLITQYKDMDKMGTPHIDDNRMDFARMTEGQVQGMVSIYGRENTLKLFTFAYEEIKKNRELHPLDVRYHIQEAQLALVGAQITGNPAYIEESKALMEDAITKSPKRQQLYYVLSISRLYERDYKGAKEALETTLAHSPKTPDGWWRLAGVYLEEGDVAGAKEVFLRGERAGLIFNDPSSARLREAAGLPAITSSTKQ